MNPAVIMKLIVLGLAFLGGMMVQGWRKNGEIGALNTTVATLEGEKTALGNSVRAKDKALEVLVAENQRRIKEADAAQERIDFAEAVAEDAKKQLDAKGATYQKHLDAARAKSPSCAALLSADINKVCNL